MRPTIWKILNYQLKLGNPRVAGNAKGALTFGAEYGLAKMPSGLNELRQSDELKMFADLLTSARTQGKFRILRL